MEIYQVMLRLVVCMNQSVDINEKRKPLGNWKRKNLRKIYSMVCEEYNWRILKNAEFYCCITIYTW